MGESKMRVSLSTITIVGLGILVAAGLGAWMVQLATGLIVTNMRNIVSWGFYISLFAFFVGISAGGLIVAASGHIFHVEVFKPISRLAVVLAAASVVLAAVAILPDLGRPDKIIYMFLYPNWLSPLIWDLVIIFVYLIISLLDLWFMLRADLARRGSRLTLGFNDVSERALARDRRMVYAISFVALPAAVLLHSITAWIFGTQIGRPWWNTALMAPIFLASAMVSGLGLVLLSSLIMHHFKGARIQAATFDLLAKLLAVIIPVDLFLIFNDFLTRAWAGAPEEMVPLLLVVAGPYTPFLVFEWVFGGLVPFVLLAYPRTRASHRWLALAALLVMAGVLAYRVELVVPAYINPLIQLPPGTSLGESLPDAGSFAVVGSYFPSVIEFSIVVGLLAGLALLVILFVKWLPVVQRVE